MWSRRTPSLSLVTQFLGLGSFPWPGRPVPTLDGIRRKGVFLLTVKGGFDKG
jgi:hypothetical protein